MTASLSKEQWDKQVEFRRTDLIKAIDQSYDELKHHIEANDFKQMARAIAVLANTIQYYITFLQTGPLGRPYEDNEMLEINTVFSQAYTINPDYIMGLGPAESWMGVDYGSTLVLGVPNLAFPKIDATTKLHTFVPYETMREQINLCRESIRKERAKAKQEIDKMKRE